MASLNTYLQQTQRFLRDQKQDLLDPADLIEYVNRSRREVAMRAQCIRRLTPISGAIISATVTAPGAGYTNSPTVTLSAPDFPSGQGPFPNGDQATAAAIVQSGTIAAIDITYGGAGYFQPIATITDSTGSGAEATLALSFINQLNQGREQYSWADTDLSMFPGVQSIYWIQSVSLLFSNFRYSLPAYAFSEYQAKIRTWSQQFQYVPACCSYYGQGVDGLFFMYPIPSQAYQLEWDCLCLPSDLTTDLSVEAIPAPWDDIVPYFAAHLCFAEIQNYNASKYYFELFDTMLLRRSQYARPGRAVNMYSRY